MAANLHKARELATRIRLSEDKANARSGRGVSRHHEGYKDSMLRHGVLISKSVTPSLETYIMEICDILGCHRERVAAFVYNSADIQATCFAESDETCVLRFSSGLVNLMDEYEFKFVAGHEIGHFLLGHGACDEDAPTVSSEGYMISRARELSADRMGFLASGSREKSIQAIIKMASGLNEEFLRFDVQSFMEQAEQISNPSRGEARNSTHPSMLIRCRALLWFTMSVNAISEVTAQNTARIEKVNARVTKDLERFVDGQVRLKMEEFEGDTALWKSALLIFQSGSFAKNIQARLSDDLGEENLTGLKSFFSLYSKDELEEEIQRRLDSTLSSLAREFPTSAEAIASAGFKRAHEIVEG